MCGKNLFMSTDHVEIEGTSTYTASQGGQFLYEFTHLPSGGILISQKDNPSFGDFSDSTVSMRFIIYEIFHAIEGMYWSRQDRGLNDRCPWNPICP